MSLTEYSYMPGTVPSNLYESSQECTMSVFVPFQKHRKLALRKLKSVAKGHTGY